MHSLFICSYEARNSNNSKYLCKNVNDYVQIMNVNGQQIGSNTVRQENWRRKAYIHYKNLFKWTSRILKKKPEITLVPQTVRK